MKVRCIDNIDFYGEEIERLKLNKVYDVVKEDDSGYVITDENGEDRWFTAFRFEVVEDEEVKDMVEINEGINFAEVMNHILDGQTWSNGTLAITKEQHGISIKVGDVPYIFTNDHKEFRLQKPRKQVSFNEAFEQYEEGKEIISLVSNERYKKIDGNDKLWCGFDNKWVDNDFEMELVEIRGKWIVKD